MNRSRAVAAAGLAALLLAIPALAQEKKLKKSELPAAVQKAVDEQSQGATVVGFSTEKENGQTIYEAQLTVNGKNRDISFDPKGSVLEVEDEVAFDSLPAPVQDGLKKKAGAGKITKVEALTKKGKLVAYEAAVLTGAKKSEVQVGPDGKPLAHEE
ncbi:MAG TPA: PepSY-like domain-containing protein [Candidatus Acidoferrales bacterium]|nr:PepSY-like domain-containing protein [Candidatus Acidoferrales bacterium]